MLVDTRPVQWTLSDDYPVCIVCGEELTTLQEIEHELCKTCQVNQAWEDLAREERDTQDSLRFGLHE